MSDHLQVETHDAPPLPTPAGRVPYGVYARLEDPMGVLSIALGQWEDRDDTKADPWARQNANKAMDEIDRMIATLYAMRSRLVGEIRESDDATGRRVDALLSRSGGLA